MIQSSITGPAADEGAVSAGAKVAASVLPLSMGSVITVPACGRRCCGDGWRRFSATPC